MWQYTKEFGYYLTDYRMSDVAAYYSYINIQRHLEAIRDIDPSVPDDELMDRLAHLRTENHGTMLNLVPQAPKSLGDTHSMAWDMDSLLDQIDGANLRITAVVAMGSYVARSAVEAVHAVAQYIEAPRQRYAYIVNALHKLGRPHKREWLARARGMVASDIRLRDLDTYVHFVRDPTTRRFVMRIKETAFRDASLRGSL